MSKVLSVIEAVFGSLRGFAKANPALAAGAVSVLVTLLARFGFHATATQLTALFSAVAVLLGGLVHVSTAPSGKHESAQREEHG